MSVIIKQPTVAARRLPQTPDRAMLGFLSLTRKPPNPKRIAVTRDLASSVAGIDDGTFGSLRGSTGSIDAVAYRLRFGPEAGS